MIVLFFIILIPLSFLFMEFVAWFTHKYIMHGFLWTWHRSHHKVHTHRLERNDLFALIFSIPSVIFIYIGMYYESFYWCLCIGIGIFLYGVFYFIFHDIIVHRRIPLRFKTRNKYMKRIINAHYSHHKTHTKEGAEAFGFLYALKKYNTQ